MPPNMLNEKHGALRQVTGAKAKRVTNTRMKATHDVSQMNEMSLKLFTASKCGKHYRQNYLAIFLIFYEDH